MDTGLASLPFVGHKGAPKKFRGKYNEVTRFLKHYERLCEQKNITKDEEKVLALPQYCSRHVREFMEGLDSYGKKEWANFRRDILKYYDADRDIKRYKVRDLGKYTKHYRKQGTVKDLADWKKYIREYIRIAGWLKTKGKLTEQEDKAYFWAGIPRSFRRKLEDRLLSVDSSHDMEKAFDKDSVNAEAEKLLHRNRFDRELLPSDDSDTEYSGNEDSDTASDEDSSSGGSDSDDDFMERLREKRRKRMRKQASSRKDSPKSRKSSKPASPANDSDKSDQDKTPRGMQTPKGSPSGKRKNVKDTEIEELINRLNKMSVSDQEYAGLYLRACQINPMVKDILESLNRQKQAQPLRGPMGPPFPPSRGRDGPPRMPPSGMILCFGCGKAGHTTGSCPKVADLMSKKVIKRDPRGQLVMFNGEFIRRIYRDEPLISAAQK